MNDDEYRVGEREVEGVKGKFGVAGVEGDGEKLIEICI